MANWQKEITREEAGNILADIFSDQIIDALKNFPEYQRERIISRIGESICLHCGSDKLPCCCRRND